MPLRVPPQPRRIYVTNPLKLVICQIRHPVNAAFDEPGFLTGVQEALKADYPRLSKEQQFTLPLMMGGAPAAGGLPAPPSPGVETLWRFQDVQSEWSLVIARSFVNLESTAYPRYEAFRTRFESVLDVLTSLRVTHRERLGLRYINEIRHPDAGNPRAWRALLNADVLGMLGGDVLGDDVVSAAQDIRLREPDGVFIIRHGYVGPESAQDGESLYSIDLDIADEEIKPLDADETLTQVAAFHQRIKDIFELSITDELRSFLQVKEVLDD